MTDPREPGTAVRLVPRKMDSMFECRATRVLVDEKEETLRNGRIRVKRTQVASSIRIEPNAVGTVIEHSVPWDEESEFADYVLVSFGSLGDDGPPYVAWRKVDEVKIVD